MRAAHHPSSANHLLAAVPEQAYQLMRTGLESVELTYAQVLYVPEGLIRYVYFPINCLVSLLTAVDKRRTLEVGMVGNEGMVGMPMALGIGVSAVRALVQGSGTAMRMTAARFRTEFKNNLQLQRAIFRYDHLLMAQVSQTAACNRFHQAQARLARWLLMTSDRLHADEFLLTHEFLSHMLGVRREGVTKAANAMHQKRLIDYSRGNIKILDRTGLEAAACTCYRIIKDLQDRAQALRPKQNLSAACDTLNAEPETTTHGPPDAARCSSVAAPARVHKQTPGLKVLDLTQNLIASCSLNTDQDKPPRTDRHPMRTH